MSGSENENANRVPLILLRQKVVAMFLGSKRKYRKVYLSQSDGRIQVEGFFDLVLVDILREFRLDFEARICRMFVVHLVAYLKKRKVRWKTRALEFRFAEADLEIEDQQAGTSASVKLFASFYLMIQNFDLVKKSDALKF